MSNLSVLLGPTGIQWIVILIAIDVILGIVAALLKKEFRLGKAANFMWKPVLGYVFGFTVLIMIAQTLPSLIILAAVAYFLIILALIGSIVNNLGKMGIKLPVYLGK
ncbi:MAG: phage holin family protein [bacterium]|nr:phage holin family protein [bacterium]